VAKQSMDNILWALDSSQTALDLGCGSGSFKYDQYPCKVIGMDLELRSARFKEDKNRIWYVRGSGDCIPLADSSVDAVICNHTFEHFLNHRYILREIDRILKSEGLLWIAIPNGRSFDDILYRLLFLGGGHANRFTVGQLTSDVQAEAHLQLQQVVRLFSGFVYLQRFHGEDLRRVPLSAKFLSYIPTPISRALVISVNALVRLIDKYLGGNMSQYGWGFVFSRAEFQLSSAPSLFNVCWRCGSGNEAKVLRSAGRLRRSLGLTFYSCANCNTSNPFIEPPPGLS
jgi:ubiquinone/menaquinone biosynthesis C-methylase UbiE